MHLRRAITETSITCPDPTDFSFQRLNWLYYTAILLELLFCRCRRNPRVFERDFGKLFPAKAPRGLTAYEFRKSWSLEGPVSSVRGPVSSSYRLDLR